VPSTGWGNARVRALLVEAVGALSQMAAQLESGPTHESKTGWTARPLRKKTIIALARQTGR